MEYGRFFISGEDGKTLACIKNVLVSNGHIFVGHLKETHNLLRCVRSYNPDLVIIEVCNNFTELKRILEVIDEEMLAACILILDARSDEIFDFLRRCRIITYISKPVFEEVALQIFDISLVSFKRLLAYDEKIKKLNNSLESRKIVEKAKWALVEKEGFSEAQAYEAIKKKSRDNRMPMREIAEAIILSRG